MTIIIQVHDDGSVTHTDENGVPVDGNGEIIAGIMGADYMARNHLEMSDGRLVNAPGLVYDSELNMMVYPAHQTDGSSCEGLLPESETDVDGSNVGGWY